MGNNMELKNASLLEGIILDDYELRAYSTALMAKRHGETVPGRVMDAWKKGEALPRMLHWDKGCRDVWEMDSNGFLSVQAAMDFYRNGPSGLRDRVKEHMVRSHRDYIFYIMNHYFAPFIAGYSDDLYSCGAIGLLTAMDGYDGRNAFTTYSKFFIIHEMAAFTYYLKENPSCYYARLQREIKKVMEENDGISIPEISAVTGIRQDIVERELRVLHATEFVRLDENTVIRDSIVDNRINVEETAEKRLLCDMLAKVLSRLEAEELELVVLYFWKEWPLARIAREKGLCYSRVKKEYDNILYKLRKELCGL